MQIETCPGCFLETEVIDGPVHRYLESSPGCWSKFGEVLSREYANYAYMSVHELTVDAYALQHPGKESAQTISSAHVHLGSLYSHFALGTPVSELTKIRKDLTKQKAAFNWLEPPESSPELTVADVLGAASASEHKRIVRKWAASVFEQWAHHHSKIAEILANSYE